MQGSTSDELDAYRAVGGYLCARANTGRRRLREQLHFGPRTLDSVNVRLHLRDSRELNIEDMAQVDDRVPERVEDFLSVVQDSNDVVIFCAGDILAAQ